MEGIILIIAAIILFIAFIAFLIAADEVNGQKRQVAMNQQTVEKDLDEAEKVLFAAAILSLFGGIVAIMIALFGYSGKRKKSDPRQELYYKDTSIRFWIFLAFLSPAVAGFLAFEARRRTEISSISQKRQEAISSRINIGFFTSWSGALLVLVAFVLTFTGRSSNMLKTEIAEEETEELKSREEASRQINPVTQVTGWNMSGPAVREPMRLHHLMRPQPTSVTQDGRPVIPTQSGAVPLSQPFQPIETFTQYTEVSGVIEPGQPIPGQPISGQPISGQPISGQPISGQSISGQPIPGQPISGQPISGQPISGQPGSNIARISGSSVATNGPSRSISVTKRTTV